LSDLFKPRSFDPLKFQVFKARIYKK